MKRILLGAAALAFFTGSYAQPTLTQANNAYAEGDEFNLYTSDFTDDGSDGAGSTWDYSGAAMAEVAGQKITIIAPSGSGAAYFPSANVMLKDEQSGGTIFAFYKTSESALSNYGTYIDASSRVVYTDPEDLMRYPMTIGTSYTDSWHGTVYASGVTMGRGGATTVTATGYGTLITPGGTYTNVLKVLMNQLYADTFMGEPMINYDFDIYQWFVPGYHYTVAGLTFTDVSGSTGAYAAFTDAAPTSVKNVIGLQDLISFYPNPAQDKIFIKKIGDKNLSQVSLTDISGKVIREFAGEAANQIAYIDISNLPSANYILHVVTKDGMKAGELIVKK